MADILEIGVSFGTQPGGRIIAPFALEGACHTDPVADCRLRLFPFQQIVPGRRTTEDGPVLSVTHKDLDHPDSWKLRIAGHRVDHFEALRIVVPIDTDLDIPCSA